MVLRPPCELVVKKMLPNFRILIAQNLQSRGYSQNRIAKALGLTQAAVNYYLQTNVREAIDELLRLGFDEENLKSTIEATVDYLANGRGAQALTLLCSQCIKLRSSSLMCNEHYREVPVLKGCNICSTVLGEVESEDLEVLDSLRLASAILEHSRQFPYLIPEVNTNIVMAKVEAKSVEDVAAIPGRIVKVGDRARSVSNPRFGASRHLARILLSMMKKKPRFRAAINLKFNSIVEEALRTLGIRYVLVKSEPRKVYISEVELEKEISSVIWNVDDPPEALVDLGGVGYEPALYLFGEDAVDVAQKAIGLASAYLAISESTTRR